MCTKQVSLNRGQSLDFETFIDNVVSIAYSYSVLLMQMECFSFAEVLNRMLNRIGEGKTVSGFWGFLVNGGYEIEKTSLYRYFNQSGNSMRVPRDRRFLELFRDYLGMTERDYVFLMLIWRFAIDGYLDMLAG